MNKDIRIAVGFFEHPKTVKLHRRCGPEGVICLMRLWIWASQERPSGDLTGMDPEDVEIAAKWEGEPGRFFDFVQSRFVDVLEDGQMSLHDWTENNSWAAGAGERADKGRLNRMKSLHPESYQLLVRNGIVSLSKQDYTTITSAKDKLRATQALLKLPLSDPPSPGPTPTPTPTPVPTPLVIEPKDIVCLFQVRIDDLASKYPMVDVDKVKVEILKWAEKHPYRRDDDVKINQKIIDIMEKEQSRAEKRCQLTEVFETMWSRYPKKDGDKKKVRQKIERQITTEQDIADIQKAFSNYMEHVRLEREGGFPDLKYKGRETWFNNWRSWVEWEPTKQPERAGGRSQIVGGYVVK